MTAPTGGRSPRWWPPDASRCFDDLVTYRLVGASSCADRITSALSSVAVESALLRRSVADDVEEAGALLCGLKPDTALYRNIARALSRAAADGGARGVRRTGERLARTRGAAQAEVVRVAVAALANAETVLVHDYSSMVLRILDGMATARRVVVTAGEPLGQGARVARAAAAAGHAVTYTPDMSVGRVICQVDAYVTGVETFYPDGSFVNTVGSLMLGLLCRHAGVPVIAPAELLKCDRAVSTAGRASLPARLLTAWPAESVPQGVSIVDLVLDPVPAELVTFFATEAGTLAPSEIGTYADAALAELFG